MLAALLVSSESHTQNLSFLRKLLQVSELFLACWKNTVISWQLLGW